MGTTTTVHSAYGKYVYEFEFTIGAAGAVVANADGSTSTDPEVRVIRTGAGTYRADIIGNFQRVIRRQANYNPVGAGSSVQAQITAVGLGTGTPTATGEAVTVVTIVTGNSNATPAAADQTTGSVSVFISFQKHKI